jgi:D-alanine-D-alanine ligase
MAYHRIHVPEFAVFPRRRQVSRPRQLGFPLVVKSVNVEGSVGISKSSLVRDDAELKDRVQYIHEALGTYAIAEEYIEGRELYVGIMGNLRLKTFPVWELLFEKAPEDMPVMATEKAKWDPRYQKRWGITTRAAADLPAGHDKLIPHLSKRIYRILGLTGYARLDFRMSAAGDLYLLEANPNPQLAHGEDFADSAAADGMPYDRLLQQICTLGLQYSPHILS